MDDEAARLLQETIEEIQREADQEDYQLLEEERPNPLQIVPAPVVNVIPEDQDYLNRVAAFLRQPIVKPPENVKYKYAKISREMVDKTDWSDLEWKSKRQMQLEFYSDDEFVIELGKKTYNDLTINMTQKTVGGIFLLAYNLTTFDNQRVFGEVNEELIDFTEYKDYRNLSVRTLKLFDARNPISINQEDDSEYSRNILRKAFCFYSCSLLRLYTKAADNYVSLKNHVQRKFENFYHEPFPIDDINPAMDVVQVLKNQLELEGLFKNTFYSFLYAGESTEEGGNLKDFLYRQHVAFTGLHAFVLFSEIMEQMKVNSQDLSYCLHSSKLAPELEAISNVITNFMDAEKRRENPKQMWRYARIFDSKFLTCLQTKNCKIFTLILAELLELLRPTPDSSAKNIAQLKGLGPAEHRLAAIYAQRAFQVSAAETYDGPYAGVEHAVI